MFMSDIERPAPIPIFNDTAKINLFTTQLALLSFQWELIHPVGAYPLNCFIPESAAPLYIIASKSSVPNFSCKSAVEE